MNAVAHSVSIRDLSLSFGQIAVLKNLNLDIDEGEFLVLLGPSGCGKSTLLNCIAGLLDVSEGQILISGNNVTWAEPKDRGIGMVFQSYALYPQMSVRRNLSFSLKVAGLKKDEIERRIAHAAHLLQIEDLLERKPAALSGGQRQRVAIGRALVRDVEVFLFDEPLSNLDAKLRADLRVEIKRLHQRLANTMIYVTHDQIEAMTLADRIAIMKNGIIQQLGAPQDIYKKPANLFVAGFIGSPSMNMLKGKFTRQSGPALAGGSLDVDLSRYEFDDTVPEDGQELVLGVRPEHIALGEGARQMPVKAQLVVDLTEPTGADTLAWCRFADDSTLAVRCDADVVLVPGQPIEVGFDPAMCSLFDERSGERI